MSFLRLLLAFGPWIALLIFAQGGLFWLKVGLVVALALSVIMGIVRLHRGVILWVGLGFFVFATIAVAVLDSMWVARHMGVFANGALAAAAWATIALGKPFSLEYAREQTDPALWNRPDFIRTNVVITAVWAITFSANAILAWGKMARFGISGWAYEALSYALLLGAAAFTTWYANQRARSPACLGAVAPTTR